MVRITSSADKCGTPVGHIASYSRNTTLPRHRHHHAYVSVVASGGYIEAGDCGRWRAEPGTVIFHEPFEAHRDIFAAQPTKVLNLPVGDGAPRCGCGVIENVDLILRTAERDLRAAAQLIAEGFRPGAQEICDWPDLLAAALRQDPSLSITAWANRMNLAPATVSRGFAQIYGLSPKRFRLEVRTRRAILSVMNTHLPLSNIAMAHDFADQAHMTRAVRLVGGVTPSALRANSIQQQDIAQERRREFPPICSGRGGEMIHCLHLRIGERLLARRVLANE